MTYHLVSKHKHSLKRELSLAVVEEIFKTGSKEVNNHNVIVAFNTEPMYVRDSNYKKTQFKSVAIIRLMKIRNPIN